MHHGRRRRADATCGMIVPNATVLLTTRNRREELRRTLHSVGAQRGAVLETLVLDDGSTDGTAEMVSAEFPAARLERREDSRGLIVRRNEGARLAGAPIVFSVDDDAEFSGPDTVARTLAEFGDPRIGAVAIPFANVQQGPRVFQRAPDGGDANVPFVTDTFIGTAHALRRDVFLSLGGYREHFIHQGEESDFCLRLLGAGYVVRLGRAEPIWHHESPLRDRRRMDYYGRRNDVLFAVHNVPAADLPRHLTGTVLNGLRAAARASHPGRMLVGLVAGLWEGRRRWGAGRKPVSRAVYRLHRHLKKSGPLSLKEVAAFLPPLPADEAER